MERRILAELFVEDDRAIKEDLGIIDYVEREAGWMSDSGIRIGDMRILDDDDQEDAKVSDFADTIFKSEEGEPISVYVVTISSTIDSVTDTTTKIFSTREKAKAYFDECVADEKANGHLMELDDRVFEEFKNHFIIWQDGYYCENHCEIKIIEREID